MKSGTVKSHNNWYEHRQERKFFVIGTMVLLSLAILSLSALRDPLSYDSFWHLKMGQDWAESGLSPWQDHYSFTYREAEIAAPPVLFKLGLYHLVNVLGLKPGFKVFKMACFTIILLLALVWLKKAHAPVLVYCLMLPLLVAALQFRAIARPELISHAFSICALLLYERVMHLLAKALDEVRRREHQRLTGKDCIYIKGQRYTFWVAPRFSKLLFTSTTGLRALF